MNTPKTSQIVVRLTDVERGKLIEEAGPHGSISSVIRMLIAKHKPAKRMKG